MRLATLLLCFSLYASAVDTLPAEQIAPSPYPGMVVVKYRGDKLQLLEVHLSVSALQMIADTPKGVALYFDIKGGVEVQLQLTHTEVLRVLSQVKALNR